MADVAIRGDRIVRVAKLDGAHATVEVNATGLAVAPGFINMMSWATTTLVCGRPFAERHPPGSHPGSFWRGRVHGTAHSEMQKYFEDAVRHQYPTHMDHACAKASTHLVRSRHLVQRGFVRRRGDHPRIHVLGFADRAADDERTWNKCEIWFVQAMQDGALGVASRSDLCARHLRQDGRADCTVQSRGSPYDGIYISHMRSEGNELIEAIDELIAIAHEAALARRNLSPQRGGQEKLGQAGRVIRNVEAARAQGLHITADMYTYTAGATGLDASMPPWVQEGGYEAWTAAAERPCSTQTRCRRNAQPDR